MISNGSPTQQAFTSALCAMHLSFFKVFEAGCISARAAQLTTLLERIMGHDRADTLTAGKLGSVGES